MFARFLNVQYIWIDSLCIIQDENWLEDWFQEAGRMQNVYAGGLLNLAADAAVDGTKGLFFDRDASLVGPCFFSLPSDEGIVEYRVLAQSEAKDEVHGESPLSCRGWYLQERLLSPRGLHFCSDQLVWECHELISYEISGECGLSKRRRHLKAFDWETLESEVILCEVWPNIVKSYSGTQLTYGRDKLIALAGISRQIGKKIEGNYLAGLWEADLLGQLLWRGFGAQHRRPTYRAPSFSWASIDLDDITWAWIVHKQPPESRLTLAEVIETSSTLVAEDIYGAVSAAHISLHCLLKRGWVRKVTKGDRTLSWITFTEQTQPGEEYSNLEETTGHSFVPDISDLGSEHEPVYTAPLIIWLRSERLLLSHIAIAGLVLRPCGPKGTFQRIGYFDMTKDSGHHNRETGFDSLLQPSPDAADFPSESYDPVTGKHTIRII